IGNVRFAFDAGPVYLLGGLLGALYVTMALIAVREVGAGGVAAATVTGQLTFSVILDRLGVLGLEQTPITVDRMAGVVLLLLGTWLIVR
ncbi:MAG: DMT family transporter, partial [Thermoleophilia bacterium]|nr:DMT family transporter [Thermoleophilia bacterium]